MAPDECGTFSSTIWRTEFISVAKVVGEIFLLKKIKRGKYANWETVVRYERERNEDKRIVTQGREASA
ncbi:hypothetical protein OUZ56_002624 [Daphnia magna]|uniref:Uncharacterized protein n=1 Tax=Daphnia magna TaxID=35525 RepID=A0ABR0A6A6_9CRUS|nr:hypothetical protein OUZ56_002624 [Daphnia magna]